MNLNYLADWKPTGPVGPDGLEPVECVNPKEAFWSAWKVGRDILRGQGMSVTKERETDQWVATWRRHPPDHSPIPPPPKPSISIHPSIAKQLLPWQPPIVRYHAASLIKCRAALDASDTGVGKTTASLAAHASIGIRHVVALVPISVIPDWEMWIKRFGMTGTVINYEKAARSGIPGILRKGPTGFAWNVKPSMGVIFDEGHRIGGIDTLSSKLARQAHRQGMVCSVLSATIADSPMRMSALGEMLGLFTPGGFWGWAIAHGCRQGRFGWEFSGSQDATRAIGRSMLECGKAVKLTPRDIPGFPEAMVGTVILTVTKPGEIDDRLAKIAKLIRQRSQKANEEIIKLRREVEMQKLPAAVEVIKDQYEEGNSCILFVHHREAALTAANMLGCPLIIGDQKPEERQHVLKEFSENRNRQLVATDGAGGEGINLQDKHGDFPRYTMYLPSGSSRHARQVVGRTRRAGSKSKANIRFGVAAGTVEIGMVARLAEKINRVDALTDADFSPFGAADAAALAELVEQSDE